MSEDKVVLISGAASGIGRRMAERLLAEGYRVHICDSSQKNVDAFTAANPGASATLADVGKRGDVDTVFTELLENHGRLDMLINNAGIAGPAVPVEECDEDGWDDCIQINLSGTFYMTKRAVPLLRESKNASIINVASTAALMGCPHRSPYVASKWAQIGLTKTWAMELGPDGIRVNAISAGPIKTLTAKGISGFNKIIQHVEQSAPLRRNVTIDEVGNTSAFLCSDLASGITGEVVYVDAGYPTAGLMGEVSE